MHFLTPRKPYLDIPFMPYTHKTTPISNSIPKINNPILLTSPHPPSIPHAHKQIAARAPMVIKNHIVTHTHCLSPWTSPQTPSQLDLAAQATAMWTSASTRPLLDLAAVGDDALQSSPAALSRRIEDIADYMRRLAAQARGRRATTALRYLF